MVASYYFLFAALVLLCSLPEETHGKPAVNIVIHILFLSPHSSMCSCQLHGLLYLLSMSCKYGKALINVTVSLYVGSWVQWQ